MYGSLFPLYCITELTTLRSRNVLIKVVVVIKVEYGIKDVSGQTTRGYPRSSHLEQRTAISQTGSGFWNWIRRGTHSVLARVIKYENSVLVTPYCRGSALAGEILVYLRFSKLTTWNLYLPASVSWSQESTSCHVFVATEYRVSRDTVAGCNPL